MKAFPVGKCGVYIKFVRAMKCGAAKYFATSILMAWHIYLTAIPRIESEFGIIIHFRLLWVKEFPLNPV